MSHPPEAKKKTTPLATYGFIALSVCAQVAGAALFKIGAQRALDRPSHTWWSIVWTWLNPFFCIGLVCLGAQTVAWMLVLRRMPLSQAYPFMACVLPLNLLVAAAYFSEPMGWNHALGMLLIAAGVISVARADTSPRPPL